MADRDLIAEGRRLSDAATPSPWDTDPHAHLEEGCRCLSCYDSPTVTLTTNMLDCEDVSADTRCDQSGYKWEDAELIVWMRNNLLALLDAAGKLERVRAALADHPRCDIHPDDDPVSCGWKRAVADVQRTIDGTEEVVQQREQLADIGRQYEAALTEIGDKGARIVALKAAITGLQAVQRQRDDALGVLSYIGPVLGYVAMGRPKDSDGSYGLLIARDLATDKLAAEMMRHRFEKDEDMHVVIAELREVPDA